MSGTKRVLFPYPLFDAVSIATNQTSGETNVAFLDYGLIDINWTGTSPVGVLNMQILEIAADRNTTDKVDVWRTVNFTGAVGGGDIPISGNSGSHTIQIGKMPSTKIRMAYTATSGVGNLTAIISGKEA